MELVVKDYPGVGNVSSHVCSRKVGDTLRVKGCFTKIKVEANKWKRVGMVAGGSGLTPCLQVAEELLSLPGDDLRGNQILRHPTPWTRCCQEPNSLVELHTGDTTQIDLIFCNKNEGDIFLKDHLDSWRRSTTVLP